MPTRATTHLLINSARHHVRTGHLGSMVQMRAFTGFFSSAAAVQGSGGQGEFASQTWPHRRRHRSCRARTPHTGIQAPFASDPPPGAILSSTFAASRSQAQQLGLGLWLAPQSRRPFPRRRPFFARAAHLLRQAARAPRAGPCAAELADAPPPASRSRAAAKDVGVEARPCACSAPWRGPATPQVRL